MLTSVRSVVRGRMVLGRFMGSVVIPKDQNDFHSIRMANNKKIFYFTATWCPPCKRIAPIFESLSAEYPDISFVKIDVDDLPDAASFGNIRSVPTFHFRSGDKKISEFSGADENQLKAQIQALLNYK